MGNIDKNRRKWLSLGGIVLGASMMPSTVLAMVSTPKPRILSFYNVNTNERLSGEFSATTGFNRSPYRSSTSNGSEPFHEILSVTK